MQAFDDMAAALANTPTLELTLSTKESTPTTTDDKMTNTVPTDYNPSTPDRIDRNNNTPTKTTPTSNASPNVVSPTPNETAKDAPTPQPTWRSPSSSNTTSKPSTSHAHENAPPPLPAPSDGTVEHIFRNILLCEKNTIASIKQRGINDFSSLLNADPNDFERNSILYPTEVEMWTLLQKVARVQQWKSPSDVLAFQ